MKIQAFERRCRDRRRGAALSDAAGQFGYAHVLHGFDVVLGAAEKGT
jgi:hypothetical protein